MTSEKIIAALLLDNFRLRWEIKGMNDDMDRMIADIRETMNAPIVPVERGGQVWEGETVTIDGAECDLL